jgi:hypothetical protein
LCWEKTTLFNCLTLLIYSSYVFFFMTASQVEGSLTHGTDTEEMQGLTLTQ